MPCDATAFRATARPTPAIQHPKDSIKRPFAQAGGFSYHCDRTGVLADRGGVHDPDRPAAPLGLAIPSLSTTKERAGVGACWARCICDEGVTQMPKAASCKKRYVLAAILGAIGGGLAVALATEAIPRMMSRMMRTMMSQMPQKMIACMKEEGINPAEI
jgi:hypothetical protein